MTRSLYALLNTRHYWFEPITISPEARHELIFWFDNLNDLNGQGIWHSPSGSADPRFGQTLHSYTDDGLVLPCLGLAKQAKPNNVQCLQPVEIKSFKDKLLCPVACIKA